MVILQLDEQPPLIQSIFAGELDEVKELLNCKQDVNCLDSHKRSALHAAAFKGDGDIVAVLLQNGARVNAKDGKWITPLHRACSTNAETVVSFLLKYNADVTARDRLWQTPLHIAAANDAHQCVELLLNNISTPNVTDRAGRTALHHAAHNGHTYIVDLLISKGCFVNACDKKDFRPLHCASQMGHVDTVELLIRCGAEINATDRNQYTPLHVAAATGNDTICRLLISEGAHVDAQNSYGNTPLHIACLHGHLLVCQELVNSHRANLEMVNFRGQAPIHIAAASVYGVECLVFLLSQNVNINSQSLDGRTPLHMTAIHGRFTRSKSLLDKGALIDCPDKNGCTPLHIAAQYGHDLLANTLMSYGANPSFKGYEGRTPLHMCCLSGYVECCRKFLQVGVNLNALDDGGKTPIHCAAYKGSVECLDLLVSNGANFLIADKLGRLAIHYAAAQGHYQCVFTLAGIGSPINARDSEGCTPLHLSSGYDLNTKCVEYLLQREAELATKDARGFTALHYAIAGGNGIAVDFLMRALAAKAEACVLDKATGGVTPVHLAAKNGNFDVLKAVLGRCSDVDVQDDLGVTPLILASREGHTRCVQTLLHAGAKIGTADEINRMTALHYSAKNGTAESLLLLVQTADGKNNIDARDRLERTPLMLAISGNSVECVQILLKSGADPNVADAERHTSLFRAVVTGQNGVVQLLLANNAEPNVADVNGKRPIHLAAAWGHFDCLQTLLSRLSDAEAREVDDQQCTALHWACYNDYSATGSAKCVEVLLKKNVFETLEGNLFSPVHCAAFAGLEKCLELLADKYGERCVRLRDGRKRTPLHLAALHGHVVCAKFLLDRGAEVDCLDEDDRTPFIAAAQFGQSEIIELLLNYEVDRNYQDREGNTALHWACLKKHSHTALLLLEDVKDAKVVDLTNKENKTALHISSRNGLVDVTRQLLKKGASVMAVDSEGYTPALCCAPDSNVAQCLALILLKLPSIAALNAPDNDTLNLSEFFSRVSKPAPTKNRQCQTNISFINSPSASELKSMSGARKWPVTKTPDASGTPRRLPTKHDALANGLNVNRSIFRADDDCFIVESEQNDTDGVGSRNSAAAMNEGGGGLDLHKSFSDMSITVRDESDVAKSDSQLVSKVRSLKELCDRKKVCHDCTLLRYRCSDCTIRQVMRKHLQGKTTPSEFNEFLMKAMNETSIEFREKLLQILGAIGKEFSTANSVAHIDWTKMFGTETNSNKHKKQTNEKSNKFDQTWNSRSPAKKIENREQTSRTRRQSTGGRGRGESGAGSIRGYYHRNSANIGAIGNAYSYKTHQIGANYRNPKLDGIEFEKQSSNKLMKEPDAPEKETNTSQKYKASADSKEKPLSNFQTFFETKIDKESVFHIDFLTKLKQIKLECIRQREEEYFQAIANYVTGLLRKFNFDSEQPENSEVNKTEPMLNESNPKEIKDRLNESEQLNKVGKQWNIDEKFVEFEDTAEIIMENPEKDHSTEALSVDGVECVGISSKSTLLEDKEQLVLLEDTKQSVLVEDTEQSVQVEDEEKPVLPVDEEHPVLPVDENSTSLAEEEQSEEFLEIEFCNGFSMEDTKSDPSSSFSNDYLASCLKVTPVKFVTQTDNRSPQSACSGDEKNETETENGKIIVLPVSTDKNLADVDFKNKAKSKIKRDNVCVVS